MTCAVREVEPHGVASRVDPTPGRFVDETPDLAKAPAQLAAWIVGDVPQQLAEPAALNRMRSDGQIGEKRTHLAR